MINLTRRGFLFGAAALAGSTALAPAAKALAAVGKNTTLIATDFLIIDPATKNIRWVGASDKTYTAREFHSWLMNEFDSPDLIAEDSPVHRATDHILHLENGWTSPTKQPPM